MRWIILIAYFCCMTQVFSQFPISNYNSDIARIVLEMEKEVKPAINIESYLQKIDTLAELIRCEFDTCRFIEDTISKINQVLFYRQHLGFQDECEFISDIFDKQCGNCASFSALYLAITSRLGMKNMYPVLAPNHVFVRYDFNGKKINIETTQKGDEYSNEWYRTYFGISEKYLLSDTYFRNLSYQEFIAVLINNRGNEFHRTGKPEKAIKDFKTALSMFPTLAEVYFGLAEYYQDTGDTTMAIEQYDSVIKYNPDFVNAYCNRGLLFEQTGMFDMAINDYNTALKLKPDFAEIYYNRGVTYTRKGNYHQAILEFTKALRIKPNYTDAYYNRGCAKNLSKDYAGAVHDYTRCIELGHTDANTYIYRGDCRNAIGDKQGACEDWKIGFELGYKLDNKKRILKYCKK